MNDFKSSGQTMTFTAPSGGVTSGGAVLVGTLVVISTNTIAEGLPFEGATKGMFMLPKATSQTWAEGQLLYWD
ncbi:MAG: capsid cement protein, partial [Kofleriaceae bacterium]